MKAFFSAAIFAFFSLLFFSCANHTNEFDDEDDKFVYTQYFEYEGRKITVAAESGYGKFQQQLRDYQSGAVINILKNDDSFYSVRANRMDSKSSSVDTVKITIENFPDTNYSQLTLKNSVSSVEATPSLSNLSVVVYDMDNKAVSLSSSISSANSKTAGDQNFTFTSTKVSKMIITFSMAKYGKNQQNESGVFTNAVYTLYKCILQ